MKNHPKKIIGILGGGQLARMLASRAHDLGIEVKILSENSSDPAAQVVRDWSKGNPKNVAPVRKFAADVDILTFESEFASKSVLDYLEGQKSCKVFPSAQVMKTLQNKFWQKQLLADHKLPTSEFVEVLKKPQLLDFIKNHKLPVVLKTQTDGYDGKGVFIIKSTTDKELNPIFASKNKFYVEEFVPFKRELAISVARSSSGDISFFPLVESMQEEQRCLWVKGPVSHPGERALKNKLKKMLTKLNYVGLISFELFDTGKGLLINEVAPRVHNSAHYSLDGLNEDQFSAHLKAINGSHLITPKSLTGGFAMYNLIGDSIKEPKWDIKDDIKLCWYGKAENRPGRKMGHINAVGPSPAAALKKVKQARKGFKL